MVGQNTNALWAQTARYHYHYGTIFQVRWMLQYWLSLSYSQSTTDLLIKARPPKRHLLLAMPDGDDLEEQRTTINPSRTKCRVDGTPRQRFQLGHDMEDANVDRP
jgi:hypothetical protein